MPYRDATADSARPLNDVEVARYHRWQFALAAAALIAFLAAIFANTGPAQLFCAFGLGATLPIVIRRAGRL